MDLSVDKHMDSEAVVVVTVVVTVETEVAAEMLAQATTGLTVLRRLLITNNCDFVYSVFCEHKLWIWSKRLFFIFVVNFSTDVFCSTVWKIMGY